MEPTQKVVRCTNAHCHEVLSGGKYGADLGQCANNATVHAHTGATEKSATTPRCKDRQCSLVCQDCWQHFAGETPEATRALLERHRHQDAGYGYGCADGPAPDPLAKAKKAR